MSRILPFFLFLLIMGCKKTSVAEADLHYLNGYWEIDEVVFPDGSVKEYGMNPSIDFIQLEENEGYRKKMQPKFDGSYTTSNDTEKFSIAHVNSGFAFLYENDFSDWEETLVQLDSTSFAVVNQDGITYFYKRFEPIKIPK
ncbi:hypothetical protein J0X14_07365 [Muricauda sp. CAU 1633]|uniref:hypothetical protein n=1 Tax=Allomuricauda sp. CAU 1633 TaxID=2816036 RepID=UPI001A8C5F8D|nr:hypothetical protein [Muricauda sp. CAU 1633]MBO0322110.1 hypothetical protein [Muricauda sp. CAU 1633]